VNFSNIEAPIGLNRRIADARIGAVSGEYNRDRPATFTPPFGGRASAGF
jgi:hypothetical protein